MATENELDEIKIETIGDANRWINIQHRMLCQDAEHIANLYNQVSWLSLPWHKRVFRKPLRRAK